MTQYFPTLAIYSSLDYSWNHSKVIMPIILLKIQVNNSLRIAHVNYVHWEKLNLKSFLILIEGIFEKSVSIVSLFGLKLLNDQ